MATPINTPLDHIDPETWHQQDVERTRALVDNLRHLAALAAELADQGYTARPTLCDGGVGLNVRNPEGKGGWHVGSREEWKATRQQYPGIKWIE